jgi:PAS domain S-box-containing protein
VIRTAAAGARTTDPGASTLFAAAFGQSKNAMVLVDTDRGLVEVNGGFVRLVGYERKALIGQPVYRFMADGPVLTTAEWRAALKAGHCAGTAEVLCADGGRVGVQWAGTSEVVTGRQLTLVVVLSTSRWGAHFRRSAGIGESRVLSGREREVVRLVALGYTGPEIADQLQIAHDTVRTHARNAMVKVDARSRAHLVAKALGQGLV